MKVSERALSLTCGAERLLAILTEPETRRRRGVAIVVGGPQYRVGSHRQFVLLAKALAERGTPVLRFDYRGMGDSTGAARTFEHVAEDLRAAVDAFASTGVEEVVLWGLCDAATAIAFYAHSDSRVRGIVLLNPWVRTAASEARTRLRHYYLERAVSLHTWRRVWRGEIRLARSARSLLGAARGTAGSIPEQTTAGCARLPERMAEGLERFRGPVLLVLSGNDLTAKEFVDTSAASRRWRRLLGSARITRRELREATHTFSRREWRDCVAGWTAEWVQSW